MQAVTPNGLDGCAVAPWIAPIPESVESGPQLVGLNRNFGLLISTARLRRCSGTPPTIRGSVAVAITRPVWTSTPIETRVSTRPRSKGPAAASIGIESP